MFFYRVPAPDEAMLVSGSKRTGGAPFEVVVGHGKLAGPAPRASDRPGCTEQRSAPHRAATQGQAKIAQAQATQAATQAEQDAQRKQLEYQRETAIAQQANEAALAQATQDTESKKLQFAQATAKVQAEANRQVQGAQAPARQEGDKATPPPAQPAPPPHAPPHTAP